MNRTLKNSLVCTALSVSLLALPVVSEAHGWGGRGGYHGGGYHGGGFGRVVAFPFLLGAAAVGAVATIAAAPFNAAVYSQPPPPPPPVYYGTPAPAYGYAPAPYGYVAPPQTCTYYPDGSSYCR